MLAKAKQDKMKGKKQSWTNSTLKISHTKTVRHHIREANKVNASPGFGVLEQTRWFQQEKDPNPVSNMIFWTMFALLLILSNRLNLIGFYFFFLQLKKRKESPTCYLKFNICLYSSGHCNNESFKSSIHGTTQPQNG